MADNYTDLLLVDVESVPYVVSYSRADAKAGSLVCFCDGEKMLTGEVIKTEYVQIDGNEWSFIEALKPIFPAQKVWVPAWEAPDMGD